MTGEGKKAFTLAEVLITLGIIGVVAAMTIPTLMVDINSKQWSTAKDVFNKKLNEAMKNMNTAQVISGHPDTLSFVNELGKHFKINKICKNNDLQSCFTDTVWWGAGEATPEEVDMTRIKQASDFGLEDWGTELIGIQFANGVTGLVAYNPACSGDPYSNQFNGTGCISMLYDTSGDKNPNTSGKDLGNYGVINKLGNSNCAFEFNGTCFGMPFSPTELSMNECETVKDELGIATCSSYHDWNGAVKACGGRSKMASPQHLADLANYLYDSTDNTATNYINNITINMEKVNSLGFTFDSWNEFRVWSNEQGHNTYRTFGKTHTAFMTLEEPVLYAICILN